MVTCLRIGLVIGCCAGLASCTSVSSLAPTPLDGRYVAVLNEVMAESASLPDAALPRAANAAAAVAEWRRSAAEDDDQGSSD